MNDRLIQEWKALAADAVRLDDMKFLKIYQLLERVAENPGVQPAFDALRPRLQELRPPRRPSTSRLFFRPIEDLLDDHESYVRRLNRISRATLAPCWRALKDRLDGDMIREFQQAIAGVDTRDPRAVAKVAEPLWRQGAATLLDLVSHCNSNLKFKVDNFGRDDDVLRQMEVAAEAIAIGPEIEGIKVALPPRPIGELAESHVEFVRQALQGLGKETAAKAKPMLAILCSRMKRPGDLLKLLGDVKLGSAMGEKEQLTKELSGYVVGNLLRQTGDMDRASAGAVQTPGDLAAQAERLTEGLNSVNDTVTSLKDRDLNNRVSSARSEIGNFVVKNLVEDLEKSLIAALFNKDNMPASDEAMKQAEQMAMGLRKSLKLAPALGIAREVNAKLAEVRKSVEAETDAMLRQLRPGSSDPKAQRQMFNSLRMIEILAGSDEAERLHKEWKRRLT
jgi:hypothetical protein